MPKYICDKCTFSCKLKKDIKNHEKTCSITENFTKLNISTSEKISSNEKSLTKFNFPKPFLKWVGGKSQIIDYLTSKFPTEINNYREIFVGGGSVLLAFLFLVNSKIIKLNGKVYAYDINSSLISLYKNIQKKPLEFYENCKKIIDEFQSIKGNVINRTPNNLEEALTSQESYYYYSRMIYNNLSEEEKNGIYSSALFLFINKTCFRGIYREGPHGINVPYGHYKNPGIIDFEHIVEISKLISEVEFINLDFNESLKQVEENDFVYLDPPYAPETKTSFVGYTKEGFNYEMHTNLFSKIKEISEKTSIMMSNADVQFVNENFGEDKFIIEKIICKRSINSKNPESKTNEVIVMNKY